MLSALGAALGASEPLAPLRWRLQLWGAALPLNAHVSDVPFAWDAENKIGVVGDWLSVEGGPVASIEAAFCSGDALAKHLAAAPSESAGLEGSYQAFETVFSRRPPAAAAPPPTSKRSDAEKQEKKLLQALKRIGQLRKMDYISLTTEQAREDSRGGGRSRAASGGLASKTIEALRRKLQPGRAVRVRRLRCANVHAIDATETHGSMSTQARHADATVQKVERRAR